jgi:hypothetical protein
MAVSGSLRPNDRGIEVEVPARQTDFSLLMSVRTGFGGPLILLSNDYGCICPLGNEVTGMLYLASPGQNPEVALVVWITDLEFEGYHHTGSVVQF